MSALVCCSSGGGTPAVGAVTAGSGSGCGDRGACNEVGFRSERSRGALLSEHKKECRKDKQRMRESATHAGGATGIRSCSRSTEGLHGGRVCDSDEATATGNPFRCRRSCSAGGSTQDVHGDRVLVGIEHEEVLVEKWDRRINA